MLLRRIGKDWKASRAHNQYRKEAAVETEDPDRKGEQIRLSLVLPDSETFSDEEFRALSIVNLQRALDEKYDK